MVLDRNKGSVQISFFKEDSGWSDVVLWRVEAEDEVSREQVVSERWEDEDEEVFGVLTISYDHHRRDVADRIMTIQHDRFVNVLCSTHVHLDHDECLEVIILRGRPREVEKMGAEIASLKGVKLARLTKACRVDA